MTVQELYSLAKSCGKLHYEILVPDPDLGGDYIIMDHTEFMDEQEWIICRYYTAGDYREDHNAK